MMKKALFILFVHLVNLTYCQETELDAKYRQEVKSLLNHIQSDFINEANIKIDGLAARITIEDCKSTYESSIFTSSELKYIKQSIDNPKIIYWSKDFFPASNIIPNEKIQELFKDGVNGWKNFHQLYGKGSIVQLSSPIFLRNYEITIIKFSITSGYLSGVGYEGFFIKRAGKWEINACSWDN